MKFTLSTVLTTLMSTAALADLTWEKSPQNIAKKISHWKNSRRDDLQKRTSKPTPTGPHGSPLKYYNRSTKNFWVNGTAGAIPDVTFDVSESYAGLLPISKKKDESRQLYFWFFPTTGGEGSEDDLVIWLNGGPGCSSLEGFLQENGPFTWQYGTFRPVPNPYTWVNLTNMVWVEQPVGTGFSQGEPNINSEEELAEQFLGFIKNFVDKFGLHKKKIWITGESYAGMYVPYIADAMYAKKDTRNYNIKGIMIYDPSIASDLVLEQIPSVPFVERNNAIFNFNDTFMANIKSRADKCGYTDAYKRGLTFPPTGPLNFTAVKGQNCDLWDDIFEAALLINPCFNVYHIMTTCPNLWDVLGFPGSFGYLPEGAEIYFNRPEVQKAVNAPLIEWSECTDKNVFPKGDKSEPSGLKVLPRVIEKSERTIISHGLLDYVLIADGTLLAIQNMTWNGAQGFKEKPAKPFVVPYDNQGDLGTWHEERGLTYIEVKLAGHMVPQYQPGAAYHQLAYLLGRTKNL